MTNGQAISDRAVSEPKNAPSSFTQHIRYEHLVAGMLGGVSATLTLHPLDLIKIRFQVSDGSGRAPVYGGLLKGFRSIINKNGWTGLYQGAAPNVVGSGSAWGLYFFGYNFLKAWMQGDSDIPLGAEQHLLAGAVAGVCTLSVTNPIWVVKTRMCLQYDKGTVGHTPQYRGMLDCLSKIWKHEGIPGLYKGFVPGLFGVSHGALQFMAYEELKKGYSRYFGTPINKKLGTFEYLCMASLSKIFAVVTTYPYQVVRSRLQNHHTIGMYKGSMDILQRIWRFEGARGFYKGLVPNILRVTPACAITFLVYENVIHVLMRRP